MVRRRSTVRFRKGTLLEVFTFWWGLFSRLPLTVAGCALRFPIFGFGSDNPVCVPAVAVSWCVLERSSGGCWAGLGRAAAVWVRRLGVAVVVFARVAAGLG